MKHAPNNYDCPFCNIARLLPCSQIDTGAVVLEEARVFACVPLHFYGAAKGNCLIVPKDHYENIFDITEDLGTDLLRMTKLLSIAMKEAFGCEGISTRQHNEPAGNQDVWHFHVHVIPRYRNDGVWGGAKTQYDDEERLFIAAALRQALKKGGSGKTPTPSVRPSSTRPSFTAAGCTFAQRGAEEVNK